MKKAHYHQRQGRVFYPNYQRTITTNRKKFCGLLIAGFFVFMMAFSAGPLYGGVGKNGAATVPYPMGASGVAYSSQGGGWSVMGQSAITRQNKHGVPGFTNDDIFVLNGMELVYASGSNPRLYHTQRESYQRIRYYNPTSPSTSYWEITTKDGTKRYYGNTTDSRIEAVGKNGQVRVWALWEVKDIDNNSTKYYYNEDTTHGDYCLSKIISGKNGCASYGYSATLLHYETDPNPRVTYGSGSLVEIDQRLRKSSSGYAIEVKMATSSSGSSGYQKSAFKIEYVLSSGGRSLISKITPYGDNGSSPMPASEYEYEDFDLVYSDYDSTYFNAGMDNYYNSHEEYACTIGSNKQFHTTVDFIDMNGDGLPDRIRKENSTALYVRKNKGRGHGFDTSNPSWSTGDSYELRAIDDDGNTIADLIDMDGDGLPDRVRKVAGGGLYVQKNTGSGFNSAGSPWVSLDNYCLRERNNANTICDFIDMNGDGLPDRVYKSGSGNYSIRFNTGSSFGGETPWTRPTGDDYDLTARDCSKTTYDLKDINADGLPDRVKKEENDSNITQLYVWLNTGKGFESGTPREWGATDKGGIDNPPILFENEGKSLSYMDMNRDGLPDRVYKELTFLGETEFQTKLNKGIEFETTDYDSYIPTDPEAIHDAWSYIKLYRDTGSNDELHTIARFIDIDGDGFPDRILKYGTGHPYGVSPFIVYFNEAGAADLLKTVKNGMGGTITYTYKPAGKKDNNPNLQNKTWVVDTVTADDGLGATGSTATKNYEYYGGLYNTDDREFRGFEKVEITDPAGNKKETHYYQDDVKKGLVKKSLTRNSSNQIFDYVYNTYEDYATTHSSHYGHGITGVYSPLLTQVDSYAVDGRTSTDSGTQPGGSTWKRMKITTSYHNYGGPSTIENFGEVNSSGSDIGYDKTKTSISYGVDTNYWVIKPYSKYVYGTNGQSSTYLTQLQERYYYDSGTGLGSWLSYSSIDQGRLKLVCRYTGSQWIYAERFGYDSYGNVTHVQDANGKTTQTVYDTKYRTFPVKTIMPTVSAGTFSSYIYYDTHSYTGTNTTTISNNIFRGRPYMARDVNSQFAKIYYDSLGRRTKIVKPGDSESYPTVETVYNFDGIAPEFTVNKLREKAGQSGTLDSYIYIDGLGRTVQTKKEGLDNETAKWITVDNWNYFDSFNTYTISETTAPYFSANSSFTRPSSPTGGRTKKKSYLATVPGGKCTVIRAPDGTESSITLDLLTIKALNANGYGDISTVDGLGNVIETRLYSQKWWMGSPYRTDKIYYNTGTGQLVKKIEDYGGQNITTTMTYDMLGRKTSTTDPDKGTWNYYYDSYDGYTSTGNLIAQQDAKLQVTKLEYDALNRLTRKDYPSGNDIDYYYDAFGLIPFSKGRLHRVEYGIDVEGSSALEFRYDERGRVLTEIRVIDENLSWTTYYSYDSMDRIDTITYPDGEVVRQTYGSDGNTDMLGTTADTDRYVDDIWYDALGRTTFMEYYNGTGAQTLYHYYDTVGDNDGYSGRDLSYRLKNITVQKGTSTIMNYQYDYDNAGNIKRIDSGNNNNYAGTYDQLFTYDYLNRFTDQTNPNYASLGSQQNYAYDAINRITNKNSASYAYYPGTHRVQRDGTNVYHYDANGNMTGKNQGSTGSAIDVKSRYKYNNDGNKYTCTTYFSTPYDSSITNYRWDFGDGTSANGSDLYEVSHVYSSYQWVDGAYKPFPVTLTATYSDGSISSKSIDMNVYIGGDANGDGRTNILDATLVGLKWGYQAYPPDYWGDDEQADGADLNNDNRVNILDATIIGTCWGHQAEETGALSVFSYTYDYDNRLTQVSGDVTATYTYDYAGRRVKKVENGVTTYYINGYYEVEGGNPIKYYYANGQRIAKNDNGTLSFYHSDHLGGSSRITNSSGSEVRKLGYMPYGSDAYSSGSGDEPYYKFTGKEQDSTGLYYYGARYYDTDLGRFISPDAMGDNYVYCGNGPVNRIDPDGNEDFNVTNNSTYVEGYVMEQVEPYNVEPADYLGLKGHPEKVWLAGASIVLQPVVAIGIGLKAISYAPKAGPLAQYLTAGGNSMIGGAYINSVVSTLASFTSGNYSVKDDWLNFGASEATMFMGARYINKGKAYWNKKFVEGYLALTHPEAVGYKAMSIPGSVVSVVTAGNIYAIPGAAAWYLKKGTMEGYEGAYWDSRATYGWTNTAAGLTGPFLSPGARSANLAFWRGIGAFCRIGVEDQGWDINEVLSENGLGGWVDFYDAIESGYSWGKEQIWGNNSVNNTVSTDYNYTDVNNESNFSRSWPGSCGNEGICLAPGTRVEINKSGKDVDKMEVGDLVLAKVEKDGEVGFFNVSKVHKDRSDELVVLTLSTGEVLRATPGHLFRANNDWKMAGELNIKDVLKDKDGNDVKIKKVEKKKGSFPVFNITVDNAHTFYAGESKVLVKSK